jgi:hypothetical protein
MLQQRQEQRIKNLGHGVGVTDVTIWLWTNIYKAAGAKRKIPEKYAR